MACRDLHTACLKTNFCRISVIGKVIIMPLFFTRVRVLLFISFSGVIFIFLFKIYKLEVYYYINIGSHLVFSPRFSGVFSPETLRFSQKYSFICLILRISAGFSCRKLRFSGVFVPEIRDVKALFVNSFRAENS